MSNQDPIGPLLACAIGDAYGAGLEYAPPRWVRQCNDLSGYVQHQKHKGIQPGSYTDDTQMAMALVEHLLEDGEWSFEAVASRFVKGFHRDPRTGYAGGFYKFLLATKTGDDFLAGIRPQSHKSGGAMRAFPLGFIENTQKARDLAMFQASLTHATWGGMMAAAGAALMFHHRYHCVGPKSDLAFYLDRWLPGCDFAEPWKGSVGSPGLDIVRAALTAFMENDSLGDVLQACIAWTGDVDTVAAIAMPAAAVCEDTSDGLPDELHEGLENGQYGYDYITTLDDQLLAEFPRASDRQAGLESMREAKRIAKAAKQPEPDPEPEGDDEAGPLDFLFDD